MSVVEGIEVSQLRYRVGRPERDDPDGICNAKPRDHDDHHHGKHKHHKKRHHHKKHPKYDNWCECPRTGRD